MVISYTIVALLEIKTSSLIKISHSCVVVVTGRQPAFLLRLAMKNFYSASFVPISSRATINSDLFDQSLVLKYSLVSLATTPDNAIRAITFGRAINPLNISAIFHTADTVRYGPMKTAAM